MMTAASCTSAANDSASADAYVRRLKLDPVFNYLHESNCALSPRTTRLYDQIAALESTDTLAMSQYLAFFNAVAADVDAPCLGAHVCGRRFSPTLAPLCELFLHADSLYAALLDLNRHSGVLQSGTDTLLDVSQGLAHVSYQVTGYAPESCRQDTEFSLFLLIYQIQLRLGSEWRPQAIHLRHAVSDGHAAILREWVDAPVVGSCEYNEIVFAAAWLGHRHPARTLAPDVQLFFRQHIDRLCEHQAVLTFTQRVEKVLEAQMGKRSLTLETVARQLHLSPRSVQRKLDAEAQAFSDVLARVRQKVALEQLSAPDRHISELAENLGFSDSAAFSKAFKRWIGVSPGKYRTRVTHTGPGTDDRRLSV